MKIHADLTSLDQIQRPVITIGSFDGVHLGHREMLKQLVQQAEWVDGSSVVITFHPHPRLVLQPDSNSMHLLHTLEEKASQLEKAGVMEVGDLYFVNIRDEQINHQFISSLQTFTSYSNTMSNRNTGVVVGSALSGEGFGEVSIQLDALSNHFRQKGLEVE